MPTIPLFPIAISSQLDDTGLERVHAAAVEERVFPTYVPAPPSPGESVMAILLNGDGESEFFTLLRGDMGPALAAPETPDFCKQVTRLSTGRLLARHSYKTFTKDGDGGWVDTGNDLDDNPSVLEVNDILITGDTGSTWRSTNFGDTWTAVGMSGNPVDFVACGTTVIALCSSASNTVFTSADYGSTWTQATLTGLNWGGPSVSGFNKFAAAVGNTAVLAGRNTSLNVPAVLVTKDAGTSWDVIELPVTTGFTEITGVNTDGTDILVVLAKPGGDTDGIVYKYDPADDSFTVVLASTTDYAANIWHAGGIWYIPIYNYNGAASWWWSANGIDWEFAEYGDTYNELMAVACDARGTGE